MSTVHDVVERLFRTMLYPPDYQPPLTLLAHSVLADTDTIEFGAWAIPEDEALVRIGSIIEIGHELMLVTNYDDSTMAATVKRGVYGTAGVPHGVGAPTLLSPPYPRSSVFAAVADNIITLYPKLYTVNGDQMFDVSNGVAAVEDPLAVEVISVWTETYGKSPDIDAKIVDFHPTFGTRALVTNIPTGPVWVRYRRRMASPTSEADDLYDLGVDERWVNIIIIGAAADLLAGRDVPKAQSDWVSNTLEAEHVEVGTRATLSVGLARYRELLMDRASQEMGAEYRPKVRIRDASDSRSRAWIG
jgi:hypothetical protein